MITHLTLTPSGDWEKTMKEDERMTDWREELRELLEKATPGPWYATNVEYPDDRSGPMCQDEDGTWTVSVDPTKSGWCHDGGYPGYGISETNARLIALLRNHADDLLKLCKAAVEAETMTDLVEVLARAMAAEYRRQVDAQVSWTWAMYAPAIITALESSGYRVVPVEPTEAMLAEGWIVIPIPNRAVAERVWAAMLAAAPKVTA